MALKKFAVVVAVSAIAIADASNDWNTPCFNGSCQYSLPSSATNPSSGTMKIWGSVNSISDITTAAGWEILDCSPDAKAQDIRLVCRSDSMEGCAHLHQNIGAVGKIVRLPENCGTSPFARVAKAWDAQDQSIPSSISHRVIRRDGAPPKVRALHLDTNFHEIDSSKAGIVNFAVKGTNSPGVIPKTASQDLIGINTGKPFHVNKTIDLDPVKINRTHNLLVNTSISCPPVTASVNVDVDFEAYVHASINIDVSGILSVAPKVQNFTITANVTADFAGSIILSADAIGTLDSGKILIVPSIGIPGFSIGEILTVGPSFKVNAQAKASLDAQVSLNVGLNYHVDKELTFSHGVNCGAPVGAVQIQDTPLNLSVSPSFKSTGTVEAHLIPSLDFGISAFDEQTTISLDFDTSASLKLTLEAPNITTLTLSGGNERFSPPYTYTEQQGAPIPEYHTATAVPPRYSSSAEYPSIIAKPASAAHSISYTNALSSAQSPNYSPIEPTSISSSSSHAVPTRVSTALATYISAKASTYDAVAKACSRFCAQVYSLTSARASTTTKASITSTPTASDTCIVATSASVAANDTATTTSSAALTNCTSNACGVNTTASGASFDGCFEVSAAFKISANANASFFGIFDVGIQVPLFSKSFEIFKKCFGNQVSRRSVPTIGQSPIDHTVLLRRASLTCPNKTVRIAVPLADGIVGSASIR